MHAARTNMRRIIASLVLAVVAVFAVLNSAHAGFHAPGHSHGAHAVHSQPDVGPDGLLEVAAERGDAGLPDAPDCSCCHGTAPGLVPDLSSRPILCRLGEELSLLAVTVPPSAQPEGLRRPPRLL